MPVTLLNTTRDVEEGIPVSVSLVTWANVSHDVRLYVSHDDVSLLRAKVPLLYGTVVQSIAPQGVPVFRVVDSFESVGFGHQLVLTGFNTASSLWLYRRKNNQDDRMRIRILQVNFSI